MNLMELQEALLADPRLLDAFLAEKPVTTTDAQGRTTHDVAPRWSLDQIQGMGEALGDRNRVNAWMADQAMERGMLNGAPELISMSNWTPGVGIPAALEDIRLGAGDTADAYQDGRYLAAAGNAGLLAAMTVPSMLGAPQAARAMRGALDEIPGVGRFLADESGEFRLPPAANAQKTQIAGTFPTYQKAAGLLDAAVGEGRSLDFGAGLGMSRELGFDTFEPFPRAGFEPTYRSAADIPDEAYRRLTNLNVLNVVPREIRDDLVENIGRVLEPGGAGVITTRGRDVMAAKGIPGPEPMSIITSADTYQKGFAQAELREYLSHVLGDRFEVSPLRLGPAGALVRRLAR